MILFVSPAISHNPRLECLDDEIVRCEEIGHFVEGTIAALGLVYRYPHTLVFGKLVFVCLLVLHV